MTEFNHSIVLFSGDDGLPLEFNVRNTNDKSLLKAMIEHGGGLCTQSDNAVHLISPGTKVLNADLGKKLVSSRYVFDCVKQNYLLEVNDYVFTISEAQTSDISDEDSGRGIIGEKYPEILNEEEAGMKSNMNTDITTTDEKMDCIYSSSYTPSKLNSAQQKSTTSSNQSESFVEGSQDVSCNPRISTGLGIQTCEFIPLTSTAKEPDSMDIPDNYEDIEKELSPIQSSASLVNPPKRTVVSSPYKEKNSAKQLSFSNKKVLNLNRGQQKETFFPCKEKDSSNEVFSKDDDNLKEKSPNRNEGLSLYTSPEKRSCTFPRYERIEDSEDELLVIAEVHEPPVHASPIHAAVSSSQPAMGDLDQFDNLLLSKAQQKVPSDDEDCLSQSYTVSSSADAQKPNSAEMFIAGPSSQLPDSPMQVEGQANERRSYIQRLEAEVEKILQKPSPKSIQDKICLVKYVCCVKKLSPASVLQSLQQL